MFCSNCGKPVEKGAGFCASCGTAVEPEEITEAVNDTQTAGNVQETVSNTQAADNVQGAVSNTQAADNVQKADNIPYVGAQTEQAPQQVQQIQQAPKGSFCSGCGAFIEAGQQFCPKCGTAVTGQKKQKTDNEIVSLIKTMLKTPVDGITALYQSKDTKIPVIMVAVQAVFAIIYGLLLENKLISAYNEYMQNLAVNLSGAISSLAGGLLGSLAGGIGSEIASGIVDGLLGDSLDATIINMLQFNSDLFGAGAIIITAVVAIAAQILILFLLMQIFKIKAVFMDAIKIFAAKAFWSALCILIAIVLIFISPWAAIVFVLVSGVFVNHTIGQMLAVHSPQSKNQIFWIQLIFNVVEIATIALSIYYISGVLGDNLISYVSGIIPLLDL